RHTTSKRDWSSDVCSSDLVEERWVHPVGDMPLDQAAMIEPLSVAVHAVKHAGVQSGQTVVVGGAGPIGLLVASVVKAYGATTIEIGRASCREGGERRVLGG